MSIVLYLPRSETERAAAEREFALRCGAWGVGMAQPRRRYPFSRMHAFARRPDPERDPEIAEDVAADESVAAQFRAALEAVGFRAVLPMAAEERRHLRERHGSGWHIALLPSDSEPTQTFIEITLDDDRSHPTALWLYDTRTRRYLPGIRLQPFRNRVSRLLLRDGDDALRAVRDPFVEVKLA